MRLKLKTIKIAFALITGSSFLMSSTGCMQETYSENDYDAVKTADLCDYNEMFLAFEPQVYNNTNLSLNKYFRDNANNWLTKKMRDNNVAVLSSQKTEVDLAVAYALGATNGNNEARISAQSVTVFHNQSGEAFYLIEYKMFIYDQYNARQDEWEITEGNFDRLYTCDGELLNTYPFIGGPTESPYSNYYYSSEYDYNLVKDSFTITLFYSV